MLAVLSSTVELSESMLFGVLEWSKIGRPGDRNHSAQSLVSSFIRERVVDNHLLE